MLDLGADHGVMAGCHDLATLAALIHQPAPQRPRGAMQYLVELNPHLGRSLRARYARWELRYWDKVDGLTRPSPDAAALLKALALTERPYSPSALQHFAACPYRMGANWASSLEAAMRLANWSAAWQLLGPGVLEKNAAFRRR